MKKDGSEPVGETGKQNRSACISISGWKRDLSMTKKIG